MLEAGFLTWMPLCPALVEGLGPFKGAPGNGCVILICGLDERHTLQHGCAGVSRLEQSRVQKHLPKLPGRGVQQDSDEL